MLRNFSCVQHQTLIEYRVADQNLPHLGATWNFKLSFSSCSRVPMFGTQNGRYQNVGGDERISYLCRDSNPDCPFPIQPIHWL